MNVMQVKVNVRPRQNYGFATIPVAIPELWEVRALAKDLHQKGQVYFGTHWGWPVQYDPEIYEEEAEFEVPDGQGGFQIEIRPFWSAASFTIGESGIWFFSLLWENGIHKEPVEFLDNKNVLSKISD